MATAPATVVVTDANVLINLIHIGQLQLLAELPQYQFRVPLEVLEEIEEPAQRDALDVAIAVGHLQEIVVDTIESLKLFGDLRDIMGRGEAACLALAATSGYYIASDEKKRFRRCAIDLIGEARILRTESLILDAIRLGRRSVADADGYKAVLETNRYSMPFVSFEDLL